nr:hypothetical protein [Streptomyces phaeoluteigriseus]
MRSRAERPGGAEQGRTARCRLRYGPRPLREPDGSPAEHPGSTGHAEPIGEDGGHDRTRRHQRIRPHRTPLPAVRTGAARAVGPALPELAGTLDGSAVRVPVEDGSLTDLTMVLDRPVTAEEINAAYREAADGPLKGILRVSDAPIVSRGVGDPASCAFDASLTQVHGDLVKVFGWYDNEWGYTNRLLDLTEYVAARLPRL